MALTTMVNGNGRMVIPKEIREAMDIRPGTFVLVEKESEATLRLTIVRTPNTLAAPREATTEKSESGIPSEREQLRKFLEA